MIAPRVVVTLGNFATRLLLDTSEGITRLAGPVASRSVPTGAVLVPTYHPAAALRGGGEVVARMRADFVRARAALDAEPRAATTPQSRTRSGDDACPESPVAEA